MKTLYIEYKAKDYLLTQEFLEKFSDARIIYIDRYTEVFNRKNQNFRRQKEEGDVFILAKKEGEFIHKNPEYCTSHTQHNYYFSTTLNCPFDCEYCFLQGMYRSAYPVFFVNIDDFKQEIQKTLEQHSHESVMFFSSYDNDGLALDGLTHFSSDFISYFSQFPHATLEIRSKSANISSLLSLAPSKNTLIAFTLSPEEIQKEYEKRTAALEQRIQAIKILQERGWKVAVRIEPVLAVFQWELIYSNFFEILKKELNISRIENLYFGLFKIPRDFLKTVQHHYPQSKLFHRFFEKGIYDEMTYHAELKEKMQNFLLEKSIDFIGREKVFFHP